VVASGVHAQPVTRAAQRAAAGGGSEWGKQAEHATWADSGGEQAC